MNRENELKETISAYENLIAPMRKELQQLQIEKGKEKLAEQVLKAVENKEQVIFEMKEDDKLMIYIGTLQKLYSNDSLHFNGLVAEYEINYEYDGDYHISIEDMYEGIASVPNTIELLKNSNEVYLELKRTVESLNKYFK